MKTKLLYLSLLAALLAGCGQKIAQTPPTAPFSPTATSEAQALSSFELTVTRDERILFQGHPVALEQLAVTLREAGVPPAKIRLRPEPKVSVSFLLRVLKAIRVTSESPLLA